MTSASVLLPGHGRLAGSSVNDHLGCQSDAHSVCLQGKTALSIRLGGQCWMRTPSASRRCFDVDDSSRSYCS